MFPLLSYIGAVATAIWLVEQVTQAFSFSERAQTRDSEERLDPKEVARFAVSFAKTDPIIALLFMTTSVALIGKYFAGWAGAPGYSMETINLFCVIGFWIGLRRSDGRIGKTGAQ